MQGILKSCPSADPVILAVAQTRPRCSPCSLGVLRCADASFATRQGPVEVPPLWRAWRCRSSVRGCESTRMPAGSSLAAALRAAVASIFCADAGPVLVALVSPTLQPCFDVSAAVGSAGSRGGSDRRFRSPRRCVAASSVVACSASRRRCRRGDVGEGRRRVRWRRRLDGCWLMPALRLAFLGRIRVF